MAFTPLPERELNLLIEDALVAYGRAARDAGDDAAARTALAMLVWGLQGIIERRGKLRVPPEVAEEVAHDVLVRALGAAFDGSSVGELRSWLNTILDSYSDAHREVLQLHVFDGLTAPEVCERIDGMSEDNVAKIASRFRARLRAELDAGPGGGR